VRLTGQQHGVSPELAAQLARHFAGRAAVGRPFPCADVPAPIDVDAAPVADVEALAANAQRYWNAFLEGHGAAAGRRPPPDAAALFDYRDADADPTALAAEGRLFVGYHAWRAGRPQEALRLLEQVPAEPYAAFYTALIYKVLFILVSYFILPYSSLFDRIL